MAENSFFSGLSSGFSNFADGVSDFFSVGSTVSPSSNIKPDDVLKTKSALNSLGNYDPPDFGITEIPDQNMINGLKNFQFENGLKVDGVMKPGGPTENTMAKKLEEKGTFASDLLEKSKAPITNSEADNTSASVSFTDGKVTPLPSPTAPKKSKPAKIYPLTGRSDPLANNPIPKKSKAEMKKLWEEVEELKKPKQPAPEQSVMGNLQNLMKDKRYPKDEAYTQHVQDQFAKAFPGKAEYDETGKMIQPKAAIQAHEVEEFDKPKPQETDFEYQVSDGKLETEDNVSVQSVKMENEEKLDPEKAYQDYDFDKNARGDLWNAIFNEHGLDADKLADEAHKVTQEEFGESGGDDQSDAFRHAYWSFMMAKKFGDENAKIIGDGHEANPANSYYGTHNQTDGQTLMDLHNNKVGRELYKEYSDSDLSPREIILKAMNEGRLQTRPFKTK